MNTNLKNNPLLFANYQTEALEDAYEIFIDVLEEYAKENGLPKDNFNELKSMIHAAYLDRKINYFLSYKLDNLGDKIESFVDLALNNHNKKDLFTDLFYFKQTRQLIAHE